MNITAKRACTAVALALTLLPASTLLAQTAADTTTNTTVDRRDGDGRSNWSWVGLLGLAGLAGLVRRERVATEIRSQTATR